MQTHDGNPSWKYGLPGVGVGLTGRSAVHQPKMKESMSERSMDADPENHLDDEKVLGAPVSICGSRTEHGIDIKTRAIVTIFWVP